MNRWHTAKNRLSQFWHKRESRRVLVGIIIGIALLAGIGIGIYRAWPAAEETVTINPVSREEVNALVQAQVEAVIADLYPWVLEGPPALAVVEPPVHVPVPTEFRPEAEPEALPALSFEHIIWPVQGEIKTPFGWYRHPVYGDWRFNAGLEFEVSGETVRTVLPGEVISVTSNGLETELVINHGSGWSSTYRSIKAISVGPGDRVRQNQDIALPENSGIVFFGLSHEDEPVNPQAFLH